MAEFKQGDRVVKMSGAYAGKYGTVNSVSDNGTLNVTFDGERLPKYCDPERCGKVAANASRFDTPEGSAFLRRAKDRLAAARDASDLHAARDSMLRELKGSSAFPDDEKSELADEVYFLHGEAQRRLGRNAAARNEIGVTEIRRLMIGMPRSPSISSPTATRRSARRVILS